MSSRVPSPLPPTLDPPLTPSDPSNPIPSYEVLLAHYTAHEQQHVFHFYQSLSPIEQSNLLNQLSQIDLPRVTQIFKNATGAENPETPASPTTAALESEIKPLPNGLLQSLLPTAEANKYRDIGLESTSKSEVAVLLMAGGQGTRLGSSRPKGCYDIGLPSGKPLFQIQAERIRKLGELAQATGGGSSSGGLLGVGGNKNDGVKIPWYVMTSGPTRKTTEEFFEEQNYFGLKKEDVVFFDQGVLPAFTNEGKLILSTPSTLAVAPDGNGGLYAAMRQPLPGTSNKTVLSDMHSRGIKFVHAYCVDNCLVKVADPIFSGFCITKKVETAAKVVKKENPTESVGVLALKGGVFGIVEYSELSKEKANERDPVTGDLSYRAGNIVNHFYTLPFLDTVEQMESKMVFHIARKRIPTVDPVSGETITPKEPNGMKLEMFVFDVFPFTKSLEALEVDRLEEFSPLKNAPGTKEYNPETSRRDLLGQHRRWLESAGAELGDGVEVEVSPLLSYGGEGLEKVKGLKLVKSGNAETLEDLVALSK